MWLKTNHKKQIIFSAVCWFSNISEQNSFKSCVWLLVFWPEKRYLEDWIFRCMTWNRIWSWMMHGCEYIKSMLWNLSFSFLEHWISIIVYIFNIIHVLLNFHAAGCNEMAEKLTLFKFASGWWHHHFLGESFGSYTIHCSFYSNKTIVYSIMKCNFVLQNWKNLTLNCSSWTIWLEKSDSKNPTFERIRLRRFGVDFHFF